MARENGVMGNKLPIAIALIMCAFLMQGRVHAKAEYAPASAPHPLASFERLIGGQWYLAGSYQEFEWGVGRRSVIARSYFVVEGIPKLVSEGVWYWHPEKKRIRGIFIAIDMPVEVFEYTTRFEGNSIVSELAAYNADGTKTMYKEVWEFLDDAHFAWTLFAETPEGLKEEMSGTYSRKQ
jgi:hypothetical protein